MNFQMSRCRIDLINHVRYLFSGVHRSLGGRQLEGADPDPVPAETKQFNDTKTGTLIENSIVASTE